MKYVYTFLGLISTFLAIVSYMLFASTFFVFIGVILGKIFGWYDGAWYMIVVWPLVTGVGGFISLMLSSVIAMIFFNEAEKKGKKWIR